MSVNREKALKDAGYDGAAKEERKNRQEEMQRPSSSSSSEEYTAPKENIHKGYKGSEQQKRDLEAIDEYARTHPNF